MEEKSPCRELLGNIYILYIKAKIALAETHLMRSPKSYCEKFEPKFDPKYNLTVLDYLIRVESPGYNELSRKGWILFVLEIMKILAKGKDDKFSIMKLYNKLLHKEFNEDIPLQYFTDFLKIINDNNTTSVLNKLKTLRDKFYAHSDADIGKMTDELFPTYDEAWNLMFRIEKCLIAIYKYYDTEIDLNVRDFLESIFANLKDYMSFFERQTILG